MDKAEIKIRIRDIGFSFFILFFFRPRPCYPSAGVINLVNYELYLLTSATRLIFDLSG
jgi:hypothetical protein